MQAIKQILDVPVNRELIIHLPDDATVHSQAEVIILYPTASDPVDNRLLTMKEAMNDPLFLADLQEVSDDFQHIDDEVSAK